MNAPARLLLCSALASALPAQTMAQATAGATPASAGADALARAGQSWTTRAVESATAAGWAIGRFLRSGAWGGDAALVYERDSRDSDTDGGTFDLARSTFRTTASIRNSTLVLGPRLVVGNAGLDLALMRDAYTVDGTSSPGAGHVVGYDLGMTVLPDHPSSFSVFATRTRNRLPRTFGTAREQQTSRWGGTAHVRGFWLDSTLDWTEQSFEAEARTGPGVLRDGERRRTLSYVGTRQSARHAFDVDYRRENRVDLVFPTLSFPLDTTRLRHALTLDRDTNGRALTSTLSLSRRGGAFKRNYLTAESRLDYRLRPWLDSRTAYRLEQIDTTALTTNRHTADVRVQHRMYDSLFTTVTGRGANERQSTGDRAVVGGALLLDYRKRLPGGGRVAAVLGRRYDRDENRFSGREAVVLDEPHVARLGAPFRLDLPRVSAASIVITGSAQTVIFVEGLDYTVDVVGDTIEIRVLPDGRILDGQSVVVDYRVAVAPFTTTLTAQPQFDASIDYGWIAPYLQVQRTDRTLLSGVDDGSIFDSSTRTAGLRLRGTLKRMRVAFRGARRRERSPYLAYTAVDLGETLSWSLGVGRVVVIDLEQADSDFQVPVRRETRRGGRADIRWQVSPLLALQATAHARRRHDTLGAAEAFRQTSVDAHWTNAALDMYVALGRDWGTQDGRRAGGLRIGVGATRSF